VKTWLLLSSGKVVVTTAASAILFGFFLVCSARIMLG
jgi:hypothetical protein